MSRARLQVIYNDSPIHCVDLINWEGKRLVRIRPGVNGEISIKIFHDVISSNVVVLTSEEASQFLTAIEETVRTAVNR